jgi:hypothetical protein
MVCKVGLTSERAALERERDEQRNRAESYLEELSERDKAGEFDAARVEALERELREAKEQRDLYKHWHGNNVKLISELERERAAHQEERDKDAEEIMRLQGELSEARAKAEESR